MTFRAFFHYCHFGIHLSTCFVFLFLAFPWGFIFSEEVNLLQANLLPSLEHFFGTDSVGRDLLIRINHNIFSSMLPIITIVVFSHLSAILGVVLLCGRISKLGMFFSKIPSLVYAFPLPILILAGARILRIHSIEIIWLVLYGFFLGKTYLLMNSSYSLDSKKHYWRSYLLSGGTHRSLILQYGVLREWKLMLANTACTHFQQGLGVEIILSYLGFGIIEPKPSFGNMISAHFEQIFNGSGSAIFIILICLYICLSIPRSVLFLLNKYIANEPSITKKIS